MNPVIVGKMSCGYEMISGHTHGIAALAIAGLIGFIIVMFVLVLLRVS